METSSHRRRSSSAARRSAPAASNQDEGQAALGVARAIDGDAHRRQREKQRGEQPRTATESALDQVKHQPHRGHAFEDLWQQHAPALEAQQLDARHLDPRGQRRLVDRHEARRIERVVEEVAPALRHAADARRVVLVAEAVLAEAPEPQRGGQDKDGGKRGSREHGDWTLLSVPALTATLARRAARAQEALTPTTHALTSGSTDSQTDFEGRHGFAGALRASGAWGARG